MDIKVNADLFQHFIKIPTFIAAFLIHLIINTIFNFENIGIDMKILVLIRKFRHIFALNTVSDSLLHEKGLA